jgi:hypothetical protein
MLHGLSSWHAKVPTGTRKPKIGLSSRKVSPRSHGGNHGCFPAETLYLSQIIVVEPSLRFNSMPPFFPFAFRVVFVLRIGRLGETWKRAMSAGAVGANQLLLRSQGPRGPIAIACPILTPNQSLRTCDLAWRFLHRLEVVGGFC